MSAHTTPKSARHGSNLNLASSPAQLGSVRRVVEHEGAGGEGNTFRSPATPRVNGKQQANGTASSRRQTSDGVIVASPSASTGRNGGANGSGSGSGSASRSKSTTNAARNSSSASASRLSQTQSIAIDSDADENDENDASRVTATPSTSVPGSAASKKRRLSRSGRAAAKPAAAAAAASTSAAVTDLLSDDENANGTPRRSSRAADNSQQQQELIVDDEDEEEDGAVDVKEEEKKRFKIQPKLIRDPKDGYVMGSVVRIHCKNFVTYSDVVAKPGPHLNMIIGPNGSGKSTLAAAMAIGLGFPPKLMGRSKDLKNFVRENCSNGFVEIELKGKPGKTNTTIKRSINAKDNKSTFEIDGRSASKKDVQNTVGKLNVDVNNLCCFLPQDRVKEFSAMTGVELLRETQRVVDPRLLVHQNQLTELKEQYATASKELEKNADMLEEKTRRLRGMERDVERYREKQQVEERALLLEVALPYAQYTAAKNKHDAKKIEKNAAKEKLDALKDQNAPLEAQREGIKGLCKATEKRRKVIASKNSGFNRDYNLATQGIERVDAEIEALRDTLLQLKDAEKKRKRDLMDIERKIEALRAQTAQRPPDGEPPELKAEMDQLGGQMRELQAEIMEDRAVHEGLVDQIDNNHREQRGIRNGITELNNVKSRRDIQCQREDNALWTGAAWVRNENREGRFKGTVHEPIRLLLTVKDRRHARVAEAAINYQTFKTVICTEEEDYTTVTNRFTRYPKAGSEKPVDLRINVARLPPEKRVLANYRRPMSNEQLREYGFDAFAIDLVDGPEDVLAYLCADQNLHMIPVAFGDGQNIPIDRLTVPNAPFRKFITSDRITSIQFGKYGNRSAIVQDNATRDPRLFVENIDTGRLRELEQALVEKEEALRALQDQRDAITARDTEKRARFEDLKKQRGAVEEQRRAVRDARTAFERARVNLDTERKKRDEIQNLPSEDEKRKEHTRKMARMAKDRLQGARRLTGVIDNLMKAHTADVRATCASLHASADSAAVEQAAKDVSVEMAQATEEFETLSAAFTAQRVLAREIWARAEEAKARIGDHLAEAFQQELNTGRNAQEVAAELEDVRGQLELIANVAPNTIERYEELKGVVDTLTENVRKQRNTTDTAQTKMAETKDKWLGPLREIVDRVSKNFSDAMHGLGCLGEVNINEQGDDYGKWAIRILVSFRDGESLTELTHQRQSGGERSLTTILYLISLLELSQVPFSMVDEINQGMDGRAERAIHNHLVHAVCGKPDQGQYFLITPKLLTGLAYHENMKVLCINNGDWLPEKLPLSRILTRRLANKQG